MCGVRTLLHRAGRERRPLTIDVTVDPVERPHPGYLRVHLRGDLSAYDDPRPADAFKLFLPGPGTTTMAPPLREAVELDG